MGVKLMFIGAANQPKAEINAYLIPIEEIESVEVVSGLLSAKRSLVKHPVDLVIVDLDIYKEDAFRFANYVKQFNSKVVFIANDSKYAQRAFEADVIHYLLKPLSVQMFVQAVKRYLALRVLMPASSSMLENIQKSHFSDNFGLTYPRRIFVKNANRITVLQLSDVSFISANGAYTDFKTTNGEKITASKNLKTYSDQLKCHPDFVRIHRTNLINKNFLKAILHQGTFYQAVMEDGTCLNISHMRKDDVLSDLQL